MGDSLMQIAYLFTLKKIVNPFKKYSIMNIFDSLKLNFIEIKHI